MTLVARHWPEQRSCFLLVRGNFTRSVSSGCEFSTKTGENREALWRGKALL